MKITKQKIMFVILPILAMLMLYLFSIGYKENFCSGSPPTNPIAGPPQVNPSLGAPPTNPIAGPPQVNPSLDAPPRDNTEIVPATSQTTVDSNPIASLKNATTTQEVVAPISPIANCPPCDACPSQDEINELQEQINTLRADKEKLIANEMACQTNIQNVKDLLSGT